MTDFDYTGSERKKYETVWADERYRRQADGDAVVDIAFKGMGCKPGETLIDWGCGCGRPAAKFQKLGLDVTGFDIAGNCLDPGLNISLAIGCLWDAPDLSSDYAFCTDVLEHVPTLKLDLALQTIYKSTRKAAFIQVCLTHDTFGRKLMDPPQVLHLTVMPREDWEARLKAVGWNIRMSSNQGKSRWWALCFK